MDRIVWCQGDSTPASEARIGIFDRGFLFGDAVYEVTAVLDGRMIDKDLHLDRLERSLAELSIPMPLSRDALIAVQEELIARNALQEGTVYLQVSRGEADRDFLYPEEMTPTLIGFTQAKRLTGTRAQREGISIDLIPDPRWQRRDIKTAMLLGQVLAKQQARKRGFDDVWLFDGDLVTEGASSTAHIITASGRLITRPRSQATLAGCTQRAVALLCDAAGLTLEERPFSVSEAQAAAEAFLTSASSFVIPIVRIGDKPVADGKPGPMTRRLQELYLDAAQGKP
jgi:D-alanine transaminase